MQDNGFVFLKPESFKVKIAVVSLSFEFDFEELHIIWNENVRDKFIKILNSLQEFKPDFVVFPEYMFHLELIDIFKNFSTDNNTVIIGGSVTEKFGNGYYAFSPIFFPYREYVKVYKKNITWDEIGNSCNKIKEYPDNVTRRFSYNIRNKPIEFAVYICCDFFRESLVDENNRFHIYFVPQFEKNPSLFINQAYRHSTELWEYVIGSNVSISNYRSIGTSVLNSTIVDALVTHNFREKNI